MKSRSPKRYSKRKHRSGSVQKSVVKPTVQTYSVQYDPSNDDIYTWLPDLSKLVATFLASGLTYTIFMHGSDIVQFDKNYDNITMEITKPTHESIVTQIDVNDKTAQTVARVIPTEIEEKFEQDAMDINLHIIENPSYAHSVLKSAIGQLNEQQMPTKIKQKFQKVFADLTSQLNGILKQQGVNIRENKTQIRAISMSLLNQIFAFLPAVMSFISYNAVKSTTIIPILLPIHKITELASQTGIAWYSWNTLLGNVFTLVQLLANAGVSIEQALLEILSVIIGVGVYIASISLVGKTNINAEFKTTILDAK